jgi:hypothetical protein
MSKMDGLRAMREARYADAQARAAGPEAPKAARPRPVQVAAPPSGDAPTPEAESQPEVEALCGHRAISGRTCTREAGHAAKSHRYA